MSPQPPQADVGNYTPTHALDRGERMNLDETLPPEKCIVRSSVESGANAASTNAAGTYTLRLSAYD